MMLQKPIAILSCILLLMAISSTAHESSTPVLDTAGRPLERDVEYYINPAVTDVIGALTLTSRNGTWCPLFVGPEPLGSGSRGLPVTLTPFIEDENIIREGRDVRIVFQAGSICVQSTQWVVGQTEPITGRRLIAASFSETAFGYFRIDKSNLGVYNIGWCPTDVPIRGRPRCGTAGLLDEEGVSLLALDVTG
ncbi:Kunitz family serine protease inhibitor, partial [Salmonella sp. NW1113]|uniref:Kunitz family serine protease inhibitor n=1 Tax=Salmonella sp. NW1113 TaxID=2947551 RepID=UPI003F48600D